MDGRLKLTTKGFYPPRSRIRRNEKGHSLGLLPDVEVAMDLGTLRTLRREWHEERLARVNDPHGVELRPVPSYDEKPGESPKAHVDGALIRAIALLSREGEYEQRLAESRDRVAGGTGSAPEPGADTVARVPGEEEEPPRDDRP